LLPRWNNAGHVKPSGSSSTIGIGVAGAGPGGLTGAGVTGASSALSINNVAGVPMLTAGGELESSRFLGSNAHQESSRPVDAQTSMVASHVQLALAEANSCGIQRSSLNTARIRAAEKSANGRLAGVAGGGGSGGGGGGGGGKMSLSLLAKLSIGVKEGYERAYGLIKGIKDLDDISSDFRNHVKDGKLYYESMAQSFLGTDAYESGQYGKAVAFLTTAQATLASLAKSSKSPAISYAAHVELHPAKDKAQSYQKINNSVAFEALTSKSDLLRLMPSGRDAFKLKKYTPPTPAFETTWRCTLSNTILSSKQPHVKNKSIYYEAVFSFLTLGYVFMNRAREHVLRAQTVLLKATGDPSISSLDGIDTGTGIGTGSGSTGGSSGSSLGVSLSGGSATASSITSSSASTGSGSSDNDHGKKAKLAGSSLVGDWVDHVRDEDMAQIETELKMAIELYCRAAGLFTYI
ncbi:hypothetical protein BGZ73_001350, partial [Actinomortierella ambigua]